MAIAKVISEVKRVLIVGVSVIGNTIYLKNKKNIVDIENLSSDEEKYKTNKWIVENAIEKNDKEKIERLLDNKNITKHNDLLILIKEFLEK